MSNGFLFKMFTPARSKDFVLLNDSDEMLPSNRKVLGVGLDVPFEVSDDPCTVSCCAFVVFAVFEAALGFAVFGALVDFEAEEIAGIDKVSEPGEGLPAREPACGSLGW